MAIDNDSLLKQWEEALSQLNDQECQMGRYRLTPRIPPHPFGTEMWVGLNLSYKMSGFLWLIHVAVQKQDDELSWGPGYI